MSTITLDSGKNAMMPERMSRGDDADFILFVGQDGAGHWLVQDGGGRLEGRFVSLKAALGFAEGERQQYHGRIERVATPLVPHIPFDPVAADAKGMSHG